MKFSYTKKLHFILLWAYFKQRVEPPISQERPCNLAMSSTVHSLCTDNSYIQLNWSFKGGPPSQLSVQTKVFLPLPTTCLILSSNQFPTPDPTPSLMLQIVLHHTEESLPPSWIRPPTSPYLALNTRYHNPSFSPNSLQHHFPNKDTLNSPNLRTPKPPQFTAKQIESHFYYSNPPNVL